VAIQRVAVVDYGMGNLRSVAKAIEHVGARGCRVEVSAEPARIAAADRVVFPGQGAMRDCMTALRGLGLEEVVRRAAAERPFLGICMGLQALFEVSEEHPESGGLAVLAGEVRRFPAEARDPASGARLKIPHMGWNRVRWLRPHPLTEGIPSGERFYFVHSYYVVERDPEVAIGRTEHGLEFTSAVARGNLFATQFHPEKSQHAGLALLERFLAWDGSA